MDKNAIKKNRPVVARTPFILIFIFIVMMLAGIITGEPGRVLEQAVQVCLSCIGIG